MPENKPAGRSTHFAHALDLAWRVPAIFVMSLLLAYCVTILLIAFAVAFTAPIWIWFVA